MKTATTLDNFDFELVNRSIRLYPNPLSEYITVSDLIEKENYKIYHVFWIEILNEKISDSEKIVIQNFSKGIYFLDLENGQTIKFIKE